MSAPRVSVIVPLHRLTPAARTCLSNVAALSGNGHELLVVSDRRVDGLPSSAIAVVTGSPQDTSPAEKRDAALAVARGEICAFLDDDAYPSPDWLERAVARLDGDRSVAGVGGPGVTPPRSPLLERAGGAFYESPLGSGGLRYRFKPLGGVREVDDYPAYNFFVRTEALRRVGGWNSRFYGGEDTKLCLALREAGYRLVYDPDVIVYHHRRPLFAPHMRQVGNVGRHRGYFVKAFPRTSARPVYFAPSAALIAGAAAMAWAASTRRRRRAAAALAVAGAAAIAAHARRDGVDSATAALLPIALVAGHGAYGAGFVRGLTTRRIEAM
jgi:glycosyltransferase involved in cell wall biosynthesis